MTSCCQRNVRTSEVNPCCHLRTQQHPNAIRASVSLHPDDPVCMSLACRHERTGHGCVPERKQASRGRPECGVLKKNNNIVDIAFLRCFAQLEQEDWCRNRDLRVRSAKSTCLLIVALLGHPLCRPSQIYCHSKSVRIR